MRKGFALIDLLVALAIIGVIAAILYPQYTRLTCCAHAQQNDCLINVKQLHMAMIMYASDNNFTYPADRRDTGATAVSWPSAIRPYVKHVRIFVCPSDAVITGSVVLPARGRATNLSYGLNSRVGTGKLTDAMIKYPAEMLGLMDAVSYSLTYNGTLAHVRAEITADCTKNTARHNGACNTSYMDGHVQGVAFENIPDPAGGNPPVKSPAKHFWQGTD